MKIGYQGEFFQKKLIFFQKNPLQKNRCVLQCCHSSLALFFLYAGFGVTEANSLFYNFSSIQFSMICLSKAQVDGSEPFLCADFIPRQIYLPSVQFCLSIKWNFLKGLI